MSPLTALEVVGFVTGGLSVWLAARDRWVTWPIGIVNSLAWLVLFAATKLYTGAALQVVYLALGAAGWWSWRRGGEGGEELPMRHLRRAELPLVAGALASLFAALWGFNRAFTDTDVAAADAGTTAISLVATYLLARRAFECWWLWMVVDVLFAALYASQGLWVTAALQPIFFAFCIVGVVTWRRELRGSEGPAPVPLAAPA